MWTPLHRKKNCSRSSDPSPVSSPVGFFSQAAAEHKRAEAERLRLEVFGLDGERNGVLMPSLKADEVDEVGYLPDFCWGIGFR